MRKSQSKRLRNVLYLVHESNNMEEPFDDYYPNMMEKIINHFKNKINNEKI
jgi:hypothetical protein